ncbi:RICIN domain-containing protein [Dactylosporangium sp. NPDC049742]|uniref:RICIN domain-containing protein n=1 Tax=Dactylosporangium sp. NPDC049742 TaxID=3154737 RepID=UPI00342681E0
MASGLLVASALTLGNVQPAFAQTECPVSKADLASAIAAAQACGGQVEALDRRTDSSRTVVSGDGSAKVDNYFTPRWVKRTDGTWTDLDTTLRWQGGAVVPGATLQAVTFSGGGTGPIATIADKGRQVGLTWPTALPKPVLSGSTATYPEVLPGVDLQLTAQPYGFAEVLLVKTPQAAKNPALAEIRFGLAATGVSLKTAADGGVTATDAKGATVFSSPRALMWDAAGAPAEATASARSAAPAASAGRAMPRVRQMGQRLAGNGLTIVPDQAFLADPATQYPVSIDPIFTGGKQANAWAVVASRSDLAGSSFWQTSFMNNGATYGDAGSGLTCDSYSGNQCTSTTYKVRSFFRMDTSGAQGAVVKSANFEITQKWSWTCNTASDAKLWITGGINSSTNWNNQPSWDANHTATAAANHAVGSVAGCTAPGTVSFDTTGMVQYALASGWPDMTVGLQAVSEGSNLQWKRFDSGTAVLHIDYDHAPNTPALSDLKMGPQGTISCGTTPQTAPRIGIPDEGVTLNAVLYDPDAIQGDKVKASWWVSDIAAQDIPADETAALTSGTNHTATVAKTAFAGIADNTVMSWKARGIDTDNPARAGDYSPLCYFIVDRTTLGAPGVVIDDFTLRMGGLGIPPAAKSTAVVGQSARVVLTPATGDATKVVGYRFGATATGQPTPVMSVPAAADGTAVVTVVPMSSTSINSLVFVAVKADGTQGTPVLARYNANAAPVVTPPPPSVPGDATGDRRADLTFFGDVGAGKSVPWRWTNSAAGGFHPQAVAPQGTAGIVVSNGLQTAQGDFDGDGLTDVVTFSQEAVGSVQLGVQRSDRNQLLSIDTSAQTLSGWNIAEIRVVAGDFTLDGKDDVLVQRKQSYGWDGNLFVANGTVGAPSFAAPIGFGGGLYAWSTTRMLAGDFDGDGRADTYEIADLGGCRTELRFHKTNASGGMDGGVVRWDSGAGGLCMGDATWVAANVNGDSYADIVVVYDAGNCWADFRTLLTTSATALAAPTTSWVSGTNGGWCRPNYSVVVGDYTGDGKSDLGFAYRIGYQAQAWVAASTGTGFSAPVEWANGGVGPAGTASIMLDTKVAAGQKRYQIVNAVSQTCLSAPSGASGPLLGQPCAADTLQYFTVDRRGGQYLRFHPNGDATKCIDVANAGTGDYVLIQKNGCHDLSQPWQQYFFANLWTLDYQAGPPSAPVSKISTPISGKCLDLNAASPNPNTTVWQYSCVGTAPQQWFLRQV